LCISIADKPGAEGIFDMLKGCARGIIKAPEGRTLVISDFAGIEARVLHWLCDNERVLDLFRNKQDAYIEAACKIYDVSHEEIATFEGGKWVIKKAHKDKRQVGKVAELGLGYGMGGDKFQGTAKSMAGIDLDADFAQEVVTKWRDMNPEVTRLWSQLNRAALHVAKTKRTVRLGKLILGWDTKKFLWIQLPSGRKLYYYNARITKNEDWGTPELTYLDGEKSKGTFRTKTYGGKLCENAVQAISRDLLVYCMQIIDDAGMDIILHVHDESVTEVDESTAEESKAFIHKAMTTLPPWAAGLPFDAETHISKRYRKF
jgi:DNA polymerase